MGASLVSWQSHDCVCITLDSAHRYGCVLRVRGGARCPRVARAARHRGWNRQSWCRCGRELRGRANSACDARQPRPVTGKPASKAWQCWQGQAHGSITMASRTERRAQSNARLKQVVGVTDPAMPPKGHSPWNGKFAPRIRIPTTIVEAENDEVIPCASTEKLPRRFVPGVAKMTIIEGGDGWRSSFIRVVPFGAVFPHGTQIDPKANLCPLFETRFHSLPSNRTPARCR